jgi:hypothetical protein
MGLFSKPYRLSSSPKNPSNKDQNQKSYLFNKNGTLLHKQLLLINSAIYNIKKHKDKLYPIPSTLTKKLDKLNLSYQNDKNQSDP